MKYTVQEPSLLIDFLIRKTTYKKKNIKNLLKYQNIAVDHHIETFYAYPLQVGQIVEILQHKKDMPLDILYEDHDIIVVHKPCGLLSEQTQREKQKTAYHIVKQYLSQKREKIYIVHRLDQYTSGILMFVKTQKLRDLLTHNWNCYVKTRGYIAIVEGKMKEKEKTIETYLKESKSQMVYIAKEGQKAITHYRQIKSNNQYSMLEVFLDTGRKNQIRVHLSSFNHPIVGDKKYGSTRDPLHRLGLHAHQFSFIHPITKKEMKFVCPAPESFDKLFKKY